MKNIFKAGLFAFAALSLYSCQDLMEVDMPSLSIHFAEEGDEGYVDYTIDSDGALHASVGDIVTIMIEGDMDILYRYTGEFGSQYLTPDEICTWGGEAVFQYGNRITSSITNTYIIAEGDVDDSTQYVTTYRFQDNEETLGDGYQGSQCLTAYVSKDFNGINDSLNIKSATWVQIPNELVLYPTSTTLTATGWIDVSDIPDPSDSSKSYIDIDSDYMYIAYCYKTEKPKAGYITALGYDFYTYWGPTWQVHDMDFRRTYEDGRYNYYGIYDPNVSGNNMNSNFIYGGFVMGVSMWPEGNMAYNDAYYTEEDDDGVEQTLRYDNEWTCVTASSYISATQTAEYADVAEEDWIVSKKFDLQIPPADDYAYSLKGTTTDMPVSTSLSYTEAGTYVVTLVATNMSIEQEKTVTASLTIIIE